MVIDYKLVVLGLCFIVVNLYTSSRLVQVPSHPTVTCPPPPAINFTCDCHCPPTPCPTCPTCPSCPSCPSCPVPQPCNNNNNDNNNEYGSSSSVSDEEYAIANPDKVKRVYLRYGVYTNIKRQGMTWTDDWWTVTQPTWENETYLWFNRLIRPSTVYVGFGEWMGPTILFASRIGKRAYGLEPDPTAYSFLKGNVEANPSLNSRVKVFQRCISNSWEVVSMYGAGSSISFLVKENDTNKDHLAYTEKFPEKKFTVYCMPLWEFLRDHDAETDDTFIKMDVEGAERFVIPSYIKWLSEYPHKHKPAFFISMHKFETFTEEQRADIFTVIRMYKYYGYPWERDGDVILHSTTEFKERHLPEIFLTDRSLDEYPPPRSSTP